MAVELTSPVLGQDVGYVYTGPLESWLLAEGYAKQDGYTGPGVSNIGATAVSPDQIPTDAANRADKPWFPANEATHVSIANDTAEKLSAVRFPAPSFDFDAGGVDDDAPSNVELDTVTGPAAGGTLIGIAGDNLEGVTDVTFGGVSGTNLDTSAAADGVLAVETPAGSAGPVDVVLVDASGNTTLTGGFTYA